jgi:hypothetical protein
VIKRTECPRTVYQHRANEWSCIKRDGMGHKKCVET